MSDPAVEAQIDVFLARYTPEIAAELRQARARLRAAFPRGVEMVYDNYNALVFCIGAAAHRSAAFISVAGYPRWVTLFFLPGTGLDDPSGLLEGTGSLVRSVRLKSAADLDRPEVAALIAQAIRPHAVALAAAPALTTVVKSVSPRQRPRRPAAPAKGAQENAAARTTKRTARQAVQP
jgi:hypothetical protein